MTSLKGIIVHADGKPVTDAKIILTALQNSRSMLKDVETMIETVNGEYAFSIQPGMYAVKLAQTNQYDKELGVIQVCEDSPDGTLNQYLVNAKADLKPEALRQYEMLVQQAQDAAEQAVTSSQTTLGVKTTVETAASEVILLSGKAEAAALAAAHSEMNASQSAQEAKQAASEAAAIVTSPTAPTTPTVNNQPILIIPKGTISRWNAGFDSVLETPEWRIIQGTRASSSFYLGFSEISTSQWEIQHKLPDTSDLWGMGGLMRFNLHVNDVSQATLEGKTLFEVRVAIAEKSLPPGVVIPEPTPDKPYLVVGFTVRCVNGRISFYSLDSDITSTPTSATATTLYINGTLLFGLAFTGRNFIYAQLYSSNYLNLRLTRTGIYTPENTLCLRSVANSVNEIRFDNVEVVTPEERLTYTLTLADRDGTFYLPYGFYNTLTLSLPDSPFPEGFSVNLVIEEGASIFCSCKSKRVTMNLPYGNSKGVIRAGGTNVINSSRLMQVGKDGKTWVMFKI